MYFAVLLQVNTLALSTDYVIRTGAYDMSDKETRLKGVQSLSGQYMHAPYYMFVLSVIICAC